MRKAEALRILASHRGEIARRFGVKDLYLFGSVARDEAHEASDVDVLVDFDRAADFDRFMGLKLYLEDALGVRVDLVTRSGVRSRLRPSIEHEAVHVT